MAHFDVEEVVAVAGSRRGAAQFGVVVVFGVVFVFSASFTLKSFFRLVIRTSAVLSAGYQTADATHDALHTRAIHRTSQSHSTRRDTKRPLLLLLC